MTPISNAVLASLQIRGWSASKRDDAVSREIAEQHGLEDARMARVWKSLLPKSEALNAVHRTGRRTREFHYENTLPWRMKGARILPTANYIAYTAGVRRYQAELERAVEVLLNEFDDLKQSAQRLLHSLYDESDYPTSDKLARAFAIELSIDPLPASEDLLTLGLATDESARLREQHEAEMAESFRRATEDLWSRLFEVVKRFHAQVSDPARNIHETTFDNLRRFLPILERLNLTGDERLELLRRHLDEALTGLSPALLVANPAARLRTAQAADDVFVVMSSVMERSANHNCEEVRDAA